MLEFRRLSSIAACIAIALATAAFGGGPNPKWGAVPKRVAIQSGIGISAWSLPGRSDVTESQYGIAGVTMTAEGDGTYSLGVNLFPGNQYNYSFYADTGGITYYDTVLNNGTSAGILIVSSSPAVNLNSGSAKYASINYLGSGDARRLLTVPSVNGDTTGSVIYVLNNFGGAPQIPTNIGAIPGQATIRLTWNEPATPWGNSGSMRPADILLGGGFRVFRSTDKTFGYQDISATLQMNGATSVTSEGLILGTTNSITYDVTDLNPILNTVNYYVVVSSDPYTGSPNTMQIANLTSGVPGPGSSEQVKGRTGRPVEIWFKVEGADEEKIKERDSIVWMTPQEEDGRTYTRKIAGRFIAVYVTGSDGRKDETRKQGEPMKKVDLIMGAKEL